MINLPEENLDRSQLHIMECSTNESQEMRRQDVSRSDSCHLCPTVTTQFPLQPPPCSSHNSIKPMF